MITATMSFFKSKSSSNASSSAVDDHKPFIGVQAKLNIGKSDDKYEQEADTVADKVVNQKGLFDGQPFFAPRPSIQQPNGPSIQQAQESGKTGEESEIVQEKPLQESITPIVRKKDLDTPSTEKDEIQRSSNEEEEEIQQKSESPSRDTSELESQLSNSKGGGKPMEPDTKSQMESGFGSDFSGVRIHNDSNAVQMNKNLGAKAFTNGNDIYFNEDQYNPSSKEGQHLLAHELTHTIQQGGGKGRAQTKPDIQLSPLSDELTALWNDQGKGAFYNRLRQVSPLSDPEFVPFVMTLRGDDAWLTRNIIMYGRESNWPIHLKVEREMKPWGDSGGKGAVFNLLRSANGTEYGNMQLHFSLNRVFEAGSDDIWLSNKLLQYGPEANWPIHLKVHREMKGWGDSGGKGAVFDLLRTANGSEVGNFDLWMALFSVFESGSEDIWLAQRLTTYGIEANWPIKMRIERDLKGWADSGGFAAVQATITGASNADKISIATDTAVLDILKTNLSTAEVRTLLNLLKTALTTAQVTTMVGHFLSLSRVPAGKISNAAAELYLSTETIDQNTATHLSNGTITAYYIDNLTQPPNVNAEVTRRGKNPAFFTLYYQPGSTNLMWVQTNAQGFRTNGTSNIFGWRRLTIARWRTLLVHETNHARNANPSTPLDNYKSEFRAYWVAEYRGVANLNSRASQIKAHILRDYVDIRTAYNSNATVKAAIDAHTRPDANTDNR